jgi:hypothetical protein
MWNTLLLLAAAVAAMDSVAVVELADTLLPPAIQFQQEHHIQ